MDEAETKYTNRTVAHIRRVQDNALFIIDEYAEDLKLTANQERQLIQNVMRHDSSKWSIEQYQPYINKWVRNIDDGKFGEAWKHHYNTENHHFNSGRMLTRAEMIEVVCDLQAMSQEFDEGTCHAFFEEKWVPGFDEWIECNTESDLAQCMAIGEAYDEMIEFMSKIMDCFL